MNIRTEKIRYLDIHHTAGHEQDTQAIRVEHMSPPNNWGDIGYNSVIESDGKIGVGRDVKWDGAHDPGIPKGETHTMNQIAYAISHIGNFMDDTMPDVQFQASLNEAEKVCRKYSIPIERVHKHKDQYATDCPGDKFPWERYISELGKRLNGVEDVLDVAILLFSKEDYFAGSDVAVKNGNCALFVRPADHSVPKDAMSAKHLIVVGGSSTGHANETLLSGNTKYDTCAAVAKYLG